MPRWCDHIGPLTELVECGGDRHRLTWRRGHVVIEDHDLAAERALRALGADTPACLRHLKQWRQLHSWATSTELFVQMRDRLGPAHILAPGALGEVQELSLLLTWERAWRASSFLGGGHQRLLQEELRARVDRPLRRHLATWSEHLGGAGSPSIRVELLRPGQPARLTGTIDRYSSRATVSVGVAWVLQVEARGLALIDGALVLEVLPSPTALRARAVRWQTGSDGGASPVAEPARLHRRPDRSWGLTWEDAER